MSNLASPAYTDGLSLDTRGCRSSLKSPIPKVSKTLSEALLCDSSLDNRSLTPPIRQGTKEGPTPSPPEVTVPHQCLCGLPGRDGRRGPRRGVTQAHRIPGDLLPHGPAGPAPIATGCGGARGPPDGLAAGAIQGSGAALHVRPWQTLALLLLPTQLPGVRPRPGRGVHPEPRGHVLALSPPRPERGVVGLGRVPTGPGVAFLSALGEPIHFPAADVIRRPLGDPCGRALRRLLLERGEMRLARHEPPYGRHSPRHPVMGPVTLPCGRRLAPGKALAAERTTGPHKADTRPEAALGPPLLGRIQTAPRGFVWVAASAKTLG